MAIGTLFRNSPSANSTYSSIAVKSKGAFAVKSNVLSCTPTIPLVPPILYNRTSNFPPSMSSKIVILLAINVTAPGLLMHASSISRFNPN